MRTTIFLFALSIVIVYGGFLFPQTLFIEQKIEINSPSSTISEYLQDLPKWENWLNWQSTNQISKSDYTYSQFPQTIGAFMKKNQNDTEKSELYIQSISNKNISNSDFQKLKYIANFTTHQTHLEGEFKVEPKVEKNGNNESSTLHLILQIDLGENPFIRYLAYIYYKSKIETETNKSLQRLKTLCEQ